MFALKLISHLPLALLYIVGDLLYFMMYHVVGYRKEVVLTNLKKSFPAYTSEQREAIAREFYKRFGEYMVESIKAISISADEMKKRVRFVNTDVLEPYAEAGQSVILAGSHQFNWEWALLGGCLHLPFPVDAVYQKIRNEKFDKLMLKTRGRFGGQPIEKSNILRALLKTRERQRAVAIMADQSPRRHTVKYWTTFLHQETAFFLGPEQIAKALNYPVIMYKMTRRKRGYYDVEFVKLTEPPYDKDSHIILDRYVAEVEKCINDTPANYLWSHKRWKLSKES